MTTSVYWDSSTSARLGHFSTSNTVSVMIEEEATADLRVDSWLSLDEHSRLTMSAIGGAIDTPPDVRQAVDRVLRNELQPVTVRSVWNGDRRTA